MGTTAGLVNMEKSEFKQELLKHHEWKNRTDIPLLTPF